MKTTCTVCGREIAVQVFKGTPWCCGNCEAKGRSSEIINNSQKYYDQARRDARELRDREDPNNRGLWRRGY